MELRIEEAAKLLGKSARQIRYMIETKRLPARREGKTWKIRKEDLPLTEGQERAKERKEEKVKNIAEEILGKQSKSLGQDIIEKRMHYALKNQSSFTLSQEAYQRAKLIFGDTHYISKVLKRGLLYITLAWYEYASAQRIIWLQQARLRMCKALTELLTIPERTPEMNALSELIEIHIIAGINGLARHAERNKKR